MLKSTTKILCILIKSMFIPLLNNYLNLQHLIAEVYNKTTESIFINNFIIISNRKLIQ